MAKGSAMRLLGSRYRDTPKFVLRRIDHMADQVNGFLLVFAIGLAMLDLLYLVQQIIDRLPPGLETLSRPG